MARKSKQERIEELEAHLAAARGYAEWAERELFEALLMLKENLRENERLRRRLDEPLSPASAERQFLQAHTKSTELIAR